MGCASGFGTELGDGPHRFYVKSETAPREWRRRSGWRRVAAINTITVLALASGPVALLTVVPLADQPVAAAAWFGAFMAVLGGATVLFSRRAHRRLVEGGVRERLALLLMGALVGALLMSGVTAAYLSLVTFGFEAHEKEAALLAVPILWLAGAAVVAAVLTMLHTLAGRWRAGRRSNEEGSSDPPTAILEQGEPR